MTNTIALRRRGSSSLLPIVLCLLLAAMFIYWQLKSVKAASDPLVEQLVQSTGIDAPEAVVQEAIQLAAKNLAEELGIDLKNYDLTMEEYSALVRAAAEKFGFCEQYRLVARMDYIFPCYSCIHKREVYLRIDQTFKIGQTCLEEKGRYRNELPAKNLLYQKEFEGSIFEVLVAEYVKLILFRVGIERKNMLEHNSLLDTEMILPPGNKILR